MAKQNESPYVGAPYNFIPFSNRVIIRYDDKSKLPRHDSIDPTLKSGEIHVTMTADTPVFISDGKKGTETVSELHFFKDANGHYQIPGSTLRGLIRENMQILGFGLARPGEDVENDLLFYRDMSSSNKSNKSALKQYYDNALGVKSHKASKGSSYSIPEHVASGYLYQENGVYYIRPTKSPYLRISRTHEGFQKLAPSPASVIKVAYTANDVTVKELCALKDKKAGMKEGVLLLTGRSVGKPNHQYVFPEMDTEAAPLHISNQDRLNYENDFETRKNSLKAYHPEFWALPKPGEYKPVFYINHDGHIYFGMTLFLRIGYQKTLAQGLPKSHLRRLGLETDIGAEPELVLDYPYSVLGYAKGKDAFRSRVSVGNLNAEGTPKEMEGVKTILEAPKPSYFPGYTKEGKNYNEDFTLRGYKQYWLKEAKAPSGKHDTIRFHPLPVGTKFNGVIRYKNLYEDELGLLLWCLRLEKDCYQSIGMAKPYGYGRMKLTIESLREYDFTSLYTLDGLTAQAKIADAETVDRYITRYQSYASQQIKSGNWHSKSGKKKAGKANSFDLLTDRTIRSFLYMRSTIREDRENVRYMRIGLKSAKQSNEYQNTTGILPTVEEIREEAERNKAQSQPEMTLDSDWKKLLAQKFNSGVK